VTATFFVLGYVADQYPALIEQVVDAGHEIGIHGYYHRFVYKLTAEEFTKEIDLSIEAVMRITGEMPLGHRAPYFSVNASTPWAFEVLASRGLRYDSSVFPTKNMLYGFPDAPRFPYYMEAHGLWQFPAATVRFAGRNVPMAGGFYTRTLPYSVIHRAIRSLNNQGKPAVMYIHPWEIDTGQRYKNVTPRERLTHYHGRGSLEKKLHRLFDEFEFVPLNDFYKQLEASRVGEQPELAGIV
jgi:polysaccharide deacetylase family protein (PEP-CTERM system associated)